MSTQTCDGCKSCGQNTLFKQLDEFIATQTKKRDSLIPILHKAQDIFGFLPVDVQEHVAKALGLPVSEVYGVVTFYHYFTMQPRGRHTVNVCMGTACYVRGAKKVVEALTAELGIGMGKTTEDRRFSLTAQRCFGACGLAPVIMIDDDVHGRVTPKKVAGILAQYV
jgi:NADH:ubiquinone oxidoreductase subunit E